MYSRQNRLIYLILNLSKGKNVILGEIIHIFYFSTDVNSVVDEIVRKEPLITATKIDKVKELIESKIDGLIKLLFLLIFNFKDYKKKSLIKKIDVFIYLKCCVLIYFH